MTFVVVQTSIRNSTVAVKPFIRLVCKLVCSKETRNCQEIFTFLQSITWVFTCKRCPVYYQNLFQGKKIEASCSNARHIEMS